MTTNFTTTDNDIRIKVAGRLDTVTAPEFDKAVAPYLNADEKREIIVDCSDLEYISSAGLRSLIAMLKGSKAQGRELTLCTLPEPVKTVFDMTGFTSIFKIR